MAYEYMKEHDDKVMLDAARQLEVAARTIKKLVEVMANINAAIARLS